MKNILITGAPDAGKTALLLRLYEIFKEFSPLGFYTVPLREESGIVGFEAVPLGGDGKVIAHTGIKSKHISGRYKIDVKVFEDLLQEVFMKDKKSNFYIIDEIGRIQLASKKFSKLIVDLLNSGKPLIAAIPEKGTGLISEIKKRDDVRICEVTPENFDLKVKELTLVLRDLLLQ